VTGVEPGGERRRRQLVGPAQHPLPGPQPLPDERGQQVAPLLRVGERQARMVAEPTCVSRAASIAPVTHVPVGSQRATVTAILALEVMTGALVGGFRQAATAGLTYQLENPHGSVARVLDAAGVLSTLAPKRRAA
jgi:hypothetical protein